MTVVEEAEAKGEHWRDDYFQPSQNNSLWLQFHLNPLGWSVGFEMGSCEEENDQDYEIVPLVITSKGMNPDSDLGDPQKKVKDLRPHLFFGG